MAVSLLPYCLFFLAGIHALEELEKNTVEGIRVAFTPIFAIHNIGMNVI